MPTSEKAFMEWAHKVFDELSTLNGRVEAMTERAELLSVGIVERFSHIERRMDKLNEMISGNGNPDSSLLIRLDRVEQSNLDSLPVRLDRLEQNESRRTWLLRACVVACLGCIGATVANLIKGMYIH